MRISESLRVRGARRGRKRIKPQNRVQELERTPNSLQKGKLRSRGGINLAKGTSHSQDPNWPLLSARAPPSRPTPHSTTFQYIERRACCIFLRISGNRGNSWVSQKLSPFMRLPKFPEVTSGVKAVTRPLSRDCPCSQPFVLAPRRDFLLRWDRGRLPGVSRLPD